ncbi:amino acid adenylation domain-containing protein [Xenorhabdus sp. XENO-7]|uniref:Amino acid adenylation domain-containing protein n=1 Tax=Xenorhabdus aichiensis TaxID=3025874 RepID=A0ABT5M4Y3_9GAMM|nr:amino acid adenylation domain-containing protein [Xenorhabdus aichiensis]MDC9622015.1 amino acid adenylation domain-containing protein [Xenorhabdus aichiensis]
MPKYEGELKAIPDALFEVVSKYSNKIALVFESETLSYRELWEKSAKLAFVLQKTGVKKGNKVAIKLTRNIELYLILLAVIRVGAIIVPINNVSPKQYVEESIEVANVSFLISNDSSLVYKGSYQPISVEDLFFEAKFLNFVPIEFQSLLSSDPVMILMTSGSTGKPKSVVIRHCGLARLSIPIDQLSNTADDRYLQLAEPSFAACANEIWMSLLTGATLVVYPSSIPDLIELGSIIHSQQVSILFLSGGLFRLLIEVSPDTLHMPNSVIVSGDFVSPRLFTTAAKAGLTKIFNGMGCTENSAISSVHLVSPHDTFDDGLPVPIGTPLPLVDMIVLDEHQQKCEPNMPGELCIGGAGLAEGYLDPKLTSDRFIVVSVDGQLQRYYRTDDRAKCDEFGNFTLLGRGSHICKIRGFRVELTGIEHVLREHPQIEDVIVVIEETSNEPRLHACYLSKVDSVDNGDLRNFLSSRLPSYMVPERFTQYETLPMTKNGKRDRIQMAQCLANENI